MSCNRIMKKYALLLALLVLTSFGCAAGPAGSLDASRPVQVVDIDGDGVPDQQDECAGTPAGVEVDAFGCPVTLYVKLTVPHAGGAPASPDDYAGQLARIARLMRENPTARLRIEGHSSPGISAEAEAGLSRQWARNAEQVLASLHGIEHERIEVRGLGAAEPLVPNSTLEGRRRNQRLEFTLHGYYSARETRPQLLAAEQEPLPRERMAPKPPPQAAPPAPSDLRFAYGGTDLVQQDRDRLEALGAYLRQNPQARVHLVGHTDSKGSAAFNMNLSRRRAEQVRQMLVQRFGIEASRISTEGKGESAPVASNDTEEGRLANRRVSISVQEGAGTRAMQPEPQPAASQDAAAPAATATRTAEVTREIPRVRPASQATPLDPDREYEIRVSVKQCKLWLYEKQPGGGEKLVRTYDVATPRPGVPGPEGMGVVTRIDFNPWWVPTENLKRAALRKGRQLPARVRPGSSSNPMGKFKIHLSHGSALRIHGTNQPGLIGRRVSSGCIRMHNEQGLEMARAIDEGTPVVVVD